MELTEHLLAAVTGIDGAVLLAPDGICYAIGVILDGTATPKGNPARGARYNSSVRYVEGKSLCLAVIVSEDGSAEWVPDLLPQIPRVSWKKSVVRWTACSRNKLWIWTKFAICFNGFQLTDSTCPRSFARG